MAGGEGPTRGDRAGGRLARLRTRDRDERRSGEPEAQVTGQSPPSADCSRSTTACAVSFVAPRSGSPAAATMPAISVN